VPPKLHLVLLVHAHQPVGNFDHVFEQSYARCYLPFVEVLARHPDVRVGLHYTGPLLTWIEQHHPEYFELLKSLVAKGQVELAGGGFYEPILISIPAIDQHHQIVKLADYVEEHFGKRPSGAWLAERVWEPQLASVLAEANVRYTVLDDIHFLSAGFEEKELFGDYIAEDKGQTIRIIPGQKSLRYLIPWDTVEKVIANLRETFEAHPMASPHGRRHGKIRRMARHFRALLSRGLARHLFAAFEQNSDWLDVCTPANICLRTSRWAVRTCPPLPIPR